MSKNTKNTAKATTTVNAASTTGKRLRGRPRTNFAPRRWKLGASQKQLFEALPTDSPMTEKQVTEIATLNLKMPVAVAKNVFKGLVTRNYLKRNAKSRYTLSDGLRPDKDTKKAKA